MTDSVGAFIIPVFSALQLNNAPLAHFLHEHDLEHLSKVMSENTADILQSAGITSIYSVVHSLTELSDELFSEAAINPTGEPLHKLFFSIFEQECKKFEKVLLVNDNTIGLTVPAVKKMVNILGLEEDVASVIMDETRRFCGMGFKTFDAEFYHACLKNEYLEDFYRTTVVERFWIPVNGLFSVHSIEDFRKLYAVLSDKSNAELCRKDYYDRFTELFIEYKDLLK